MCFLNPKQIYAFHCAAAENLIDFANMGGYSVVLGFAVVVILAWQTSAQTCLKSFTVAGASKSYASCNDLSTLNAALAWTYFPTNGSIDIAFRATPAASAGWVGWGINPTATAMVGTQALIAFKHSNGSTVVDTYNIVAQAPPSPSNISITVSNKSAVFENTGQITIFATLTLTSNKTAVNHVWQVGSAVNGLVPQAHANNQANLASATTIDLKTGVSSGSAAVSQKTLKDRHGIINVVGWGILMPIGAMIARYLKMFKSADPAWFYLHAFCQSSGYIIGVAGWATGLKLGSDSPGVERTPHRRIGIALFCLGTLQVFALLLRPKKDHKYRKYWNVYHYATGYTVIILTIVNIFKGFDILQPADKWKHAYIAVIASLGGIAAVLEVTTWIIFFKRKSKTSPRTVNSAYGNGGTNAGHGFKQSHDDSSV